MLRRRTCFAAVALSGLAALLGTACDEETIEPIDQLVSIDRPPGCNPLGATDACLYPFPSAFLERADAASPTGVRVAIPQELMPESSPVLDVTPYNLADGFSPVMPILLHLGVEVDTTDLPGPRTVERSMDPSALVSLVDLETGARVPHFVEMDANQKGGFEGRYAFIVRPMAPMEMGHRHAVFVRKGLRDTEGREIVETDAFAALRDGMMTDNEDVEAARAHMDEVFAAGTAHGLTRSELLLAFDFQVASKDWLLGSVLHIRGEALASTESGELGYAIDEVQVDPNEDIAKIVFGSFEVPTYLGPEDTFTYDAQHHPIREPENRSYPFTMLVPKRAATEGPLPLVVLGHGIFGNGRDFLTGGDGQAIQALAEDFGVIVVATDWIGLSSNDLPRIAAEVAPDLNRLPLITDQLQQSLVNVLVLTELAVGPLKDDPEATVGMGPLVDPTRVWYWGASLGGIQGSSYISLSNRIARAAFGVPGSSWGTMLTRSIVFLAVKGFIEIDFPDPLDQTLLTTMAQLSFDFSDPANVTRLMFKEPLPDAPPGRTVILQEAIGDSQVPNMTTDILARAMGVKLLAPAFEEPYGLEVVEAPTNESVVVQYRLPEWDDPAPPETNTPPDGENGVHHEMNFLPNVHAQIAALFLQGEVIQTCSGTCDPN